MDELSEIVSDIDPSEIEAEPSLERANAYSGEDVDLSDENKAAIDRIVSGE